MCLMPVKAEYMLHPVIYLSESVSPEYGLGDKAVVYNCECSGKILSSMLSVSFHTIYLVTGQNGL